METLQEIANFLSKKTAFQNYKSYEARAYYINGEYDAVSMSLKDFENEQYDIKYKNSIDFALYARKPVGCVKVLIWLADCVNRETAETLANILNEVKP